MSFPRGAMARRLAAAAVSQREGTRQKILRERKLTEAGGFYGNSVTRLLVERGAMLGAGSLEGAPWAPERGPTPAGSGARDRGEGNLPGRLPPP
jgi:hypothetical protein